VRAAQGDWLFRAGATLLDPKKTNLEDPARGELEFDDAVSPDDQCRLHADRSRRDRAHARVAVRARYRFQGERRQRFQFGDVELFPPTLSLQWHFNPDGRIQPFVGAGVNYTMFSE
jgi:outer membrane protein